MVINTCSASHLGRKVNCEPLSAAIFFMLSKLFNLLMLTGV